MKKRSPVLKSILVTLGRREAANPESMHIEERWIPGSSLREAPE